MASPILKYEASAGSGKTYRLALEYLGRLLLAFAGQGGKTTRSAAPAGAAGLDPGHHLHRQGGPGDEAAHRAEAESASPSAAANGNWTRRTRNFSTGWPARPGSAQERIIELSGDLIELVLASYDDFNVKTIDSLMSAMVKAVSPDLDLPADYEIAVDARDEIDGPRPGHARRPGRHDALGAAGAFPGGIQAPGPRSRLENR